MKNYRQPTDDFIGFLTFDFFSSGQINWKKHNHYKPERNQRKNTKSHVEIINFMFEEQKACTWQLAAIVRYAGTSGRCFRTEKKGLTIPSAIRL